MPKKKGNPHNGGSCPVRKDYGSKRKKK